MAVIIINPSNIELDGSNAGQLMDVLRNHPKRASEVQAAFVQWYADLMSRNNQQLVDTNKQLAAKTAEAAAEVSKITALKDKSDADVKTLTSALSQSREQVELFLMDRDKQLAERDKILTAKEEEFKKLLAEKENAKAILPKKTP